MRLSARVFILLRMTALALFVPLVMVIYQKIIVMNMKNLLCRTLLVLLLSSPLLTLASISDFTPVAHWTCDEASGVRYDSTANALDLTDNNTVAAGTGLRGSSCDFEYSGSEYLSHVDDPLLEPGNSYSWSFWMRQESDTDGAVVSKWNDTSDGYWLLSTSPSSNFNFTDEDQTANFFDAAISDGQWYHFVFTYDSSVMTLYKNGSYIATSSFPATVGDGGAQFMLGKVQFFNSNYYDGLLDEVTLFDYALTSGNVTTIYNGGTPLCYDCIASSTPPSTSTGTTSTSTSDFVKLGALSIFGILLLVVVAFVTYLILWIIRA